MSAIQENKRRYHIIIDAFDCNNEVLSNKSKIEAIIRSLADLCGMTILHGPVVLEGVPENPGITGFAIIDFSHISIHTFTAEKEACVDIFSCKPYNYEQVKKFIMKELDLTEESLKYIEVQYPSL